MCPIFKLKMKKTFFKLHLSILLAGFTGIFGKLISLNEGLLVWYRMMLTCAFIFLLLMFTKKLEKISFLDFKRIALVGCLLALHWIFFYGSIKASNVSIGVVCFSLVGFFTSILEPLILRRHFAFREMIYSLITLLGIVLIFSFDMRYRTGIILGVVSAALAALFTIATKRISNDYKPTTILLYEMLAGFLLISCILPFYLLRNPVATIIPDLQDTLYLFVFVIFCTITLQMLQIQVLKKISAFTVNLSYNLEPVYSIILAMALFGEAKQLYISFYFGVGLIILSVLLQTWDGFHKKKTMVAK